tara:strand:- start:164 stop:811 length:648 start_codon:yes stop_codon:yes gene_type:complete
MFYSLLKGFLLGYFAYIIGVHMDSSLAIDSLRDVMTNYPRALILQAYNTISLNMLIISPCVYGLTDKYLLNHDDNYIYFDKVFLLLLIHHIGYYIAHKSMHKILFLKQYHDFHHRFDKYLIPSLGNAVSTTEFLVAYISPFIFGAIIVKPNEITFVIPIALISIFNNLIHCKELINVYWPKYLVSPSQHIKHHQIRDKHYAAPILNLDYFIEKDE